MHKGHACDRCGGDIHKREMNSQDKPIFSARIMAPKSTSERFDRRTILLELCSGCAIEVAMYLSDKPKKQDKAG